MVTGICGPNKKGYGGAALEIEICSNGNLWVHKASLNMILGLSTAASLPLALADVEMPRILSLRYSWQPWNTPQLCLGVFQGRQEYFNPYFNILHRSSIVFLAAPSSSRRLVVTPLFGRSVGWYVGRSESFLKKLSNGNLNLPTYLPMWQ